MIGIALAAIVVTPGQEVALDLATDLTPLVDLPTADPAPGDRVDAEASVTAGPAGPGDASTDDQVDPGDEPVLDAWGEPDEHAGGPPPDLEISDDLPAPPLAPGVDAADPPAARPATPSGPHWVPFTGDRTLWCVYRGAGRCNGHHPYPAIDVEMP
ncbi:MAG: hypothetical protein AAGK32_11555, partial [Actinomycetota bacterium]